MTNREIELQIAEQVYGYARQTVGPDAFGQHGGTAILVPAGVEISDCSLPPKGNVDIGYFVPRFTASIIEAWLIVDYLGKRGANVQFNSIHGHTRYRARFFPVGEAHFFENATDGAMYEFAESAPLAICLAALRWAKDRPRS